MPRKCLEFESGKAGAETAQLLEVGRCRRIHIEELLPERRRFFRRLMTRCGCRRLPRYHIACLDPPLRKGMGLRQAVRSMAI